MHRVFYLLFKTELYSLVHLNKGSSDPQRGKPEATVKDSVGRQLTSRAKSNAVMTDFWSLAIRKLEAAPGKG